MTEDKPKETNRDSQVAFEHARLDYCISAFQMQRDTANMLERRASFFLSLITILMGSVFLKLDVLKDLFSLPGKLGLAVWFIVAPAFLSLLFASALLVGLVALSISMRLRRSKNPHPDKIADALFAPNSKYLDHQDESTLLRKIALNYAIALENNAEINRKKKRWMDTAFACVLCAASAFCLLLIFVCLCYVFV